MIVKCYFSDVTVNPKLPKFRYRIFLQGNKFSVFSIFSLILVISIFIVYGGYVAVVLGCLCREFLSVYRVLSGLQVF